MLEPEGPHGHDDRIRRAGDLPGVRRIVLQPRVRRAIARILMVRFLAAAQETTTPLSLVRREILSRGEVHTYRLVKSGQDVSIMHGRDLEALYELIHRDEYAVPPPLRTRLQRPDIAILDVGANIGMFSAWALGRWPSATIVAFEPEPSNAGIYRQWAAGRENVTLHEAAASNENGQLRFQTGVGSGSFVTEADTGTVMPKLDLFDHLHDADFVKIDIEGGEWPILTDARLRDLRRVVLVIEYHRHMAPFWPPYDAAVQCLESAGFSTGFNKPNYWGHGILWAWKD